MGDYEDRIRDEVDAENERASREHSWGQAHTNQIDHDMRNSGGGGGGCFPYYTKIKTPYGKIEISSIRAGDVVSSNGGGSHLSTNKVLKVEKYRNIRLYKITFDDGSCVTTTKSHSFRSQGKWVKASKLSVGNQLDFFENSDLMLKHIIKFEPLKTEAVVYNLIVESDFSFIADGAVAHSFTRLRRTRIFFWSFIGFLKNNFISQPKTC